jgi:hypothetical protein
LLHFGFQVAGDIERDRFARFFPGDEKDGMLGSLAMASTVVFSALSGSDDETSIDPRAEILDLA